MIKNPPANAGDTRDEGSIPGSGRSPAGGHGNPLQYSCLENLHGQRSLAGYSPLGHKKSNTSEQPSPAQHIQWSLCVILSITLLGSIHILDHTLAKIILKPDSIQLYAVDKK